MKIATKLDLFTTQILDDVVRENFNRLITFFRLQNHLFNFKFVELKIDKAETGLKFKHNLNYLPKDTILLSVTGPGLLTFNYNDFDKDTISLTTTDACVVRFFLGTYGG